MALGSAGIRPAFDPRHDTAAAVAGRVPRAPRENRKQFPRNTQNGS
jgi:hypothetical protein